MAPSENPEKKSIGDQLKDKLNNIDTQATVDGLRSYAESNTRDTIAFALMVIGLLVATFNPGYGLLLIGVITGIYFAAEIAEAALDLQQFVDRLGLSRAVVLGITALALFFQLPMFFVGILAAAGVMTLIGGQTKEESSSDLDSASSADGSAESKAEETANKETQTASNEVEHN